MDERERDEAGQFSGRIPAEAALQVFEEREDRARPVTAGDVVEALGCSRRTAHDKLNRLVEAGHIETRKVGARSRVFWVPIEAPEPGDGSTAGRSSAVSDAVSDADLPGSGDILERRREALLAAFDYLSEHPEAKRADFLREIYPDHPAEFESPEGWWNAIQPALGDLPGVDPPKERGHIWHYLGG